MKIAFVYDMIYPFSKGGAEKRYHCLAERLARHHEVHWVGTKLWDGPSTRVTDRGVTLHGVLRAPGKLYRDDGRRTLIEPLWFGAAILQWPGLRDMDVIDCSSFPYFSIIAARALAWTGRAAMVVTWHEFWGGYWDAYAGGIACFGRIVERLALRTSPHSIAVSEYTRRKLVRAGADPNRVSVVPNGLSTAVIDRVQPLPGGPDILFAGRLIREKRVHLLLDALATTHLRELRATCWVVGDGPEASVLHRRAAELGLGDRVRFLQWLPEADLYGAMKSAGLVCLLSEREGFGMVLLEAMAGGTPVVVATGANSAAPDLVVSGENGEVVEPDPDAIGRAMASIVGVPDRRRRMGMRARAVAAGYDWDTITSRMETKYEAAVHARGALGQAA